MPTYEYACTSCQRHFEVHQSFSDDPLEVCEVCEGKLRRVFHPVGVMFKGSGFYSTDAKSSKHDGDGKASKPKSSSSDGDSGGSSNKEKVGSSSAGESKSSGSSESKSSGSSDSKSSGASSSSSKGDG